MSSLAVSACSNVHSERVIFSMFLHKALEYFASKQRKPQDRCSQCRITLQTMFKKENSGSFFHHILIPLFCNATDSRAASGVVQFVQELANVILNIQMNYTFRLKPKWVSASTLCSVCDVTACPPSGVGARTIKCQCHPMMHGAVPAFLNLALMI